MVRVVGASSPALPEGKDNTAMLNSKTKKALAAGLAVTALGAGLLTGSASADPAQLTAIVGVGSDTTPDVMNALAGRSAGILYTPLASSDATGGRQMISFDATAATAGAADNCITTKTGAPSFTRPNGSTGGRRALSRALDGTGYGSAECGGVKDISGLVDFARSSSGVTTTTGDLTYIPFGRDALSFAYYRKNGTPVTTLTKAQLTTLFTAGPTTIDGVRIVPCGIQLGSGTYQFWNTVTTANATQEGTATALCNGLGFDAPTSGRAQESDGPDLKDRGDAIALLAGEADTQVIIGFSAGSFIARSNGKAAPAPGPGVGIGSISNNGSSVNLGSPIAGTAPNLTPNATFFNDSTFGRRVFNVFASSLIDGPGNADIKSMFVDSNGATAGNTAVICNAPYTATVETLGFLASSDCGRTDLYRGPLISGQL